MYVEYDSNNSGGRWWLKDSDWEALEKAGWKVAWAKLGFKYKKGNFLRDKDGTPKLFPIEECTETKTWVTKDKEGNYRYLGAIARCAYRVGLSLMDAAAEFDRVTSQCSTDAGCPCCGQPHNFTEYDDKGIAVASGPKISYECHW